MLERLLINLIGLRVLDQVFFDRVILIFITIVMAPKQSIEGQAVILITAPVTYCVAAAVSSTINRPIVIDCSH